MTIDLRSDTVTKPTPAMRQAMARAEVGDDVYGEDPTVNRLQEKAAEVLGKEAALFVPTGSMGNEIAIKVHTRPGMEVITEAESHIYNYELGAMAVIAGVVPRPVRGERGILRWSHIQPHVRSNGPYYMNRTGLITLENSHNMAGGVVMPVDEAETVVREAHAIGLPVHLDGARIFNAAVALKRSVSDLTRSFDSVMFCLSKGLGAPVGSLLVGSRTFIEEGRKVRKLLGGGMRQVGVLAAAGLVAIEEMVLRLEEDHALAKFLAAGLAALRGVKVDLSLVQTNIVIFDVSGTGKSATQISAELLARGVLINSVGPWRMRLVTHFDVSRNDCEGALAEIQSVVQGL
jgi:threonine aldolase